jgi:hypothetical protein
MRMLLGLSTPLPSLVAAKFTSAKATSSLLFSPTEVAIIRTSEGIPVPSDSGHAYDDESDKHDSFNYAFVQHSLRNLYQNSRMPHLSKRPILLKIHLQHFMSLTSRQPTQAIY